MSDEHDSLRYLSLDGTCDVGRSIVWKATSADVGEIGSSNNTLDAASISWDKSTVHRCLGYPPELIESSFAWWSEKIHPDDRLRVVASLERALFQSETARYWSETYRFKLYDGQPRLSTMTAAPAAVAAANAALPSMMISSGTPPAEEEDSRTPTSPSQDPSGYPILSTASFSRSPTPRQLPQLSTVAASSAVPTFTPSASSAEKQNDERGNNNSTAARRSLGRQVSDNPDDSMYITVLDQLYISRDTNATQASTPTASSSALAAATSNSSCPPDRNNSQQVKREDLAGQQQQQDSTDDEPRRRQQHVPMSAIGSIFALEQRIKTSEALHNPRSKLMRSISNLSASSNASSSATSSSNAAPPSSTGSFVSVPSSAGAMQRQQQQQQLLALHQQHHSESNQSTVSTPSSGHPYPWAAAATSPTSPVSSPSTSLKAFSFLDVEGVRTILENTQSGLTM